MVDPRSSISLAGEIGRPVEAARVAEIGRQAKARPEHDTIAGLEYLEPASMDAANTHFQPALDADLLARHRDAFDIQCEQRPVACALGLATQPALDAPRRHKGALALASIELAKRGARRLLQHVGRIPHEEEHGGDRDRARAQPTAAGRDRRGRKDDGRRA